MSIMKTFVRSVFEMMKGSALAMSTATLGKIAVLMI